MREFHIRRGVIVYAKQIEKLEVRYSHVSDAVMCNSGQGGYINIEKTAFLFQICSSLIGQITALIRDMTTLCFGTESPNIERDLASSSSWKPALISTAINFSKRYHSCFSITPHRSSIGPKSGEFPGQLRRVKPFPSMDIRIFCLLEEMEKKKLIARVIQNGFQYIHLRRYSLFRGCFQWWKATSAANREINVYLCNMVTHMYLRLQFNIIQNLTELQKLSSVTKDVTL